MKLIKAGAYLVGSVLFVELGVYGAAFLGVALGKALMQYAGG